MSSQPTIKEPVAPGDMQALIVLIAEMILTQLDKQASQPAESAPSKKAA